MMCNMLSQNMHSVCIQIKVIKIFNSHHFAPFIIFHSLQNNLYNYICAIVIHSLDIFILLKTTLMYITQSPLL